MVLSSIKMKAQFILLGLVLLYHYGEQTKQDTNGQGSANSPSSKCNGLSGDDLSFCKSGVKAQIPLSELLAKNGGKVNSNDHQAEKHANGRYTLERYIFE